MNITKQQLRRIIRESYAPTREQIAGDPSGNAAEARAAMRAIRAVMETMPTSAYVVNTELKRHLETALHHLESYHEDMLTKYSGR